jgi:c-di-GMP-binding flagellar brake protein YcgR
MEQEKKKSKDVCVGLEFGTPLNVQFEGVGSAKSMLVGIDRHRCLIIKPPSLSGIETRLFKKNQTVVSYLHEGMVYGFRCTLIGIIKTPFPLLILSYPEASETLNLRKHKRMPCLLAGRFRGGESGRKIVLTDISNSGCSLTIAETLPDRDACGIGSTIEFSVGLELIQETVTLSGVVKNVQAGGDGQNIGVEFLKATHQADLQALEKVKRYIAAVRDRVLF